MLAVKALAFMPICTWYQSKRRWSSPSGRNSLLLQNKSAFACGLVLLYYSYTTVQKWKGEVAFLPGARSAGSPAAL